MMPIIVATVECLLDSRSGLRGVAMSTGPQAPVIMVSGPYAKEIGMNSGVCAIGPGSISAVNVAIGRASRLVMMNVGHSYPAVTDMDTQGTAMKFSYCVAENEAANPWEPMRVVKGFSKDSTTVTVNCPFSSVELQDYENHEADKLLENFCTAITVSTASQNGKWLIHSKGPKDAPSTTGGGDPDHLLFLSPDHAAVFKRADWSLRKLKDELFERSKMPFRKLMLARGRETFKVTNPQLQWLWNMPDTEIPVCAHENQFEIFVVGGIGGWSTYHHGGTYSITREVKLRH
jgi:hypothetical protein